MSDKNTTIIIKRIKKGGHGHHGGAWKVAYADFVTAMMAFFLLMWLLTSTPVENLQGLADYFSPTVGMQGKLGIGFKGGKSPNTEGVSTGDWASKGLIFGAPPTGPLIRLPEESDPANRDNPKVEFTRITQEQLKQAAQTALNGQAGVEVSVTPDGLEIRVSDTEGRPLFAEGTDELQPYMQPVIRSLADLTKSLPHYIRITGHTPFNPHGNETQGKAPFYSDWELSAARANSIRRALVSEGLDAEQIAAVIGKADQEPVDEEHPQSVENARVTVTLLEETRTGIHKQSAPPGALFDEQPQPNAP